jgi:hypothetical protein
MLVQNPDATGITEMPGPPLAALPKRVENA